MNEMQAIRQIRDSLEELVLLHIDEEGGPLYDLTVIHPAQLSPKALRAKGFAG